MPKGRMLSKKISYDERVGNLSVKASLLFTWCIPHLDVSGRIYCDPYILKGTVVPYVKTLNVGEIEKLCDEMSTVGLVTIYGKHRKYMQFNGFARLQHLRPDRESPSVIPSLEEVQSNSGANPEEIQVKLNQIKTNQIKTNQFVSFCNDAMEQWNSFCDAFPICCKIRELTPSRKEKLKVRYQQESFRNFAAIIDVLKQSPYALNQAQNSKGWKVSFDFLIENDNNYMKVLEGKYGETGSEQVPESLRKFIKRSDDAKKRPYS